MATPIQTFISVGEYNIEVFDNHYIDNRVFFIFHWNSGSASSSMKIFDTDLSNNNRIIAVSLVGHGNSSCALNPQEEYTIAGIGNCISTIINHYDLSEYWLIGQSVSAHAIMETYEEFLNCSGFISISAPPITTNTLGQAFIETPASALLFKEQLNFYELNQVSRAFVDHYEHVKIVSSDFKRTDPNFRRCLGESILAGNIRDEIVCCKNFQFPALFIRAESDFFLSLDYYQLLSDEYDLDLNIATVCRSGHAILLDNSHECSSIIQKYIDRV